MSRTDAAGGAGGGLGRGLFRLSLILTLLSLLSRAFGLGRDLAVTWTFGASAETDSFYIATSLTYSAYVVIGASLTSATVPFLAAGEGAGGRPDFAPVASLLNLIILALVLLAAFGMATAPEIARLLSGNVAEAGLGTTAGYLFVLMSTIVLLGAAGVLSGILNHARIFVPVTAAPLVLNLGVILAVVVLGQRLGVGAAILGTILGSVGFVAIQLPALRRAGYRHRWRVSLPDRAGRRFLVSVLPVMAVALVVYGYTFVDIAVGARLGEGTVTAINVATKLIQLPQGVIAMGLTTATFPIVSRLAGSGRQSEAAVLVVRLATAILLVALPASALLVVSADLVVSVLFGQGTFPAAAVAETSRILAPMALALPALALNILLLRVFHAMQSWTAPMLAFLAAFVLKVMLAVALAGGLGVDAIALSTVAATWLNAAILVALLDARLDRPFGRAFARGLLRMLATALAVAAVLLALRGLWPPAQSSLARVAQLTGLALAGAGVFLALGFALLRPELRQLKSLRSVQA